MISPAIGIFEKIARVLTVTVSGHSTVQLG